MVRVGPAVMLMKSLGGAAFFRPVRTTSYGNAINNFIIKNPIANGSGNPIAADTMNALS
jgi:hypothetical protein